MRIPLLLCVLFLGGCERTLFPDTAEEVMAAQKKLPGEIFYTTGEAYGPYRLVAVVTGTVNTAGAVEPAQNLGEKSHITWPATPGYYYVGYKYIDEFGTSFYIIRKVPELTSTDRTRPVREPWFAKRLFPCSSSRTCQKPVAQFVCV